MPTTIISNGTGKCPNCGTTASLFKCKRCNDIRCWSCLQKIGGQINRVPFVKFNKYRLNICL